MNYLYLCLTVLVCVGFLLGGCATTYTPSDDRPQDHSDEEQEQEQEIIPQPPGLPESGVTT